MRVEIDENSGFCFGVVTAIDKAEAELKHGALYSLGDIVHNKIEVERLEHLGLKTIDHEQLLKLTNARVLFRAHGEPPATYSMAKARGVEIIDASCPVVLNLQRRIRRAYEDSKQNNGVVVIYGKRGHAEVIGLVGQTNGEALVIENAADLKNLPKDCKIYLFSQTTQSLTGFKEVTLLLRAQYGEQLAVYDTICRKVANRIPQLKDFAKTHDVIIFVSGKKSSNGKQLCQVCAEINEKTYFVEDERDIDTSVLAGVQSVGITGATSTPRWIMEHVREYIEAYAKNNR
ncbi:MAG: 4-hydroxy-3-methylbut-2-enyl diphosphate reductase [Marinifilaceae bacterium]